MTRHPDGIGWYFNWTPSDGEILVVPSRPDYEIAAEFGKLGPQIGPKGTQLMPTTILMLTLTRIQPTLSRH